MDEPHVIRTAHTHDGVTFDVTLGLKLDAGSGLEDLQILGCEGKPRGLRPDEIVAAIRADEALLAHLIARVKTGATYG